MIPDPASRWEDSAKDWTRRDTSWWQELWPLLVVLVVVSAVAVTTAGVALWGLGVLR